jgi:hypothetical protein
VRYEKLQAARSLFNCGKYIMALRLTSVTEVLKYREEGRKEGRVGQGRKGGRREGWGKGGRRSYQSYRDLVLLV